MGLIQRQLNKIRSYAIDQSMFKQWFIYYPQMLPVSCWYRKHLWLQHITL